MNLVSQSSTIKENDENTKTVNYFLYLNQIPLEKTQKMLKPCVFAKEAI